MFYNLFPYTENIMKIEELPLNKDIIDILKEHDISELYPPQAEALPYVLKRENMVLSIPTNESIS